MTLLCPLPFHVPIVVGPALAQLAPILAFQAILTCILIRRALHFCTTLQHIRLRALSELGIARDGWWLLGRWSIPT